MRKRFSANQLDFRDVLRILVILVALTILSVLVVLGSGLGNEAPIASIPDGSASIPALRPTVTPSPALTSSLSSPVVARTKWLTPTIPTPTIGVNAHAFAFNADPSQSGWIRNDERQPHWGERNFNVGFYGGQTYQGLLYFNLSSLPPGTQVLYASVELVGLNNDKLGVGGMWRLKMLPQDQLSSWDQDIVIDFFKAPTIAEIGTPLKAETLTIGGVNQFIFAPDQNVLLEQALNATGLVGFRLDGPIGAPNSLFTWEGAVANSNAESQPPILRIIASPGPFVVITNTPTPQNVFTAVAQAQTVVAFTASNGTPTSFPRSYATATPVVVVTPQTTPANQETSVAQSAFATLVALTTGTFTPTLPNWVTATPVYLIPVEALSPAIATLPSPSQMVQTPIPPTLKGFVVFTSNRFGGEKLLAMKPDGVVVGMLTKPDYYRVARAVETFSPDQTQSVFVDRGGPRGRWEIWIQDLNSGTRTLVTKGFKQDAYEPAWSPDGSRIAYASTETGIPEIYVYDLANDVSRQLTFSSGLDVINQRPSWSPDSQQIVFQSNRDTGHFQIWLMNADGSGLRNLSQSPSEDLDPVWVK